MIKDEDDIYDAVRKYRDEHPELMNPISQISSREAELEKCLGELVRVHSGWYTPKELVDAMTKAKSLLNLKADL